MSRFVVAAAFVMMTMTGLGDTASADQQETAVSCVSEQVLVKVLPGVDPAEVVARHGGTILKTISGIDVQVVEVPAGTLAQKVDEFSADPDVKYAEPNGIVRIAEQAATPQCQPPTASTNP
jgi:hypothetical protein